MAVDQQGRALFGEIVRSMATDAEVVDAVVAAARSDSPAVAGLPIAENRRHIAVMVVAGLTAFADREGPGREDFAAAAQLGADRAAQGIGLTELLRGVHAGRSRAIAITMERSRASGVPADLLLDVMLDFERYAGALERHVVSGYHAAELQLSRTARDTRTQLLRRLLLEELPLEGLSRAGLPPNRTYFCLVSDITDPGQAQAVERRLACPDGVFGLVEGKLTGLMTRLPARDQVTSDELVVVAPAVPLREIPKVYSTCCAALAAAGARHGLYHLSDLAVETALATQPVLATILAQELLGVLDPIDRYHRQLVTTAVAYLDTGRRLDQTATALHLHANTVRYRLSRLTALTGWSPDRPNHPLQTARDWWALTTWLKTS
ncbi:PucR family transcriptional regulator [Kribbella catacumbae]|uniref:PucR family transcriptional regulator n=1 Tax=Kribbella catacumbae TaxID=460086 RepID=UPI0003824DBC|nr:PucR family transcriptional regulator [Kribbella catacumbae]